MNISERAVQGIFYGEISPLEPFNSEFLNKSADNHKKNNNTGLDEHQDIMITGNQSIELNKNFKSYHNNLLKENEEPKNIKDTYSITARETPQMHDEVGLVNRFKESDIRYIIEILKKEINKAGNKYFLTVDDYIEIKKHNNTLNLKINLKQKD